VVVQEGRPGLGEYRRCNDAITGTDKSSSREELEIRTTAYDTFNHNVRMLNESMGICIPSVTTRDPPSI